ncbi:unnamed protein product [Nesidiocoris tenuis]|uniref:DUF4780 domain-containing protein n=1 Tax=Nesidiocoris tenuis TaxID=355587 RepID=A0A6H5GRX7_9HEMI|nr:unnamed protein product [Nesidiocoris tenuis]
MNINPGLSKGDPFRRDKKSVLYCMLKDMHPAVRRAFKPYPPVVQILAKIAISGPSPQTDSAFRVFNLEHLKNRNYQDLIEKFRPVISKLVQSASDSGPYDAPDDNYFSDGASEFGTWDCPADNFPQNGNFPDDGPSLTESLAKLASYIGILKSQGAFSGKDDLFPDDRANPAANVRGPDQSQDRSPISAGFITPAPSNSMINNHRRSNIGDLPQSNVKFYGPSQFDTDRFDNVGLAGMSQYDTNRFNADRIDQFADDRSNGRQFVTGRSDTRQFDASGPGARQFDAGGSGARQFDAGGPGARQFNAGGQGACQFDSGGPGARQFDSGRPGARQFDSGGPGARQFDAGGPGARQFDSGGSGARQFDAGGPGARQFAANGPGARQFDDGGSGARQFDAGGLGARQFEAGGPGARQYDAGPPNARQYHDHRAVSPIHTDDRSSAERSKDWRLARYHETEDEPTRSNPEPSSKDQLYRQFLDFMSSTGRSVSPKYGDRSCTSRQPDNEPFVYPLIGVTEAASGRRLSRTEAEMIELALFKRITAKDEVKCHGVYRECGAVVFACNDDRTARWLVKTVPFLLPWAGAVLKAEPFCKRLNSTELLFQLPPILSSMPWSTFCEKIQLQNDRLSTKDWKLIVEEDTTRLCSVDKRSLRNLKALDFKAFLSFFQIEFKLVSIALT